MKISDSFQNLAMDAGAVVSIWRYPVKSMQGEQIGATAMTNSGVLGDRAYS